MTLMLIAILLGAVLTIPVSAAPGDPRLVQGTLEWPATLTREPVIIVRGDDGRVYFCDVTDVRQRADGLRAGGRVSVLGLEAARPHELTTIVIAAASAPPTPAAAPEPSTAPTPPPVPAAAPPPSAAPTVVIMAPSSHATAPNPGAEPTPAPTIVPATVTGPGVAPPPPARRVTPPAAPAAGGRGQWSRLDGMVEAVTGSTLTLKMDDGAVAYVDISQLSPNVAQVLRQGTAVSVFGYPLGQKFEAAGYIQTHSITPEPRGPARTNR